MSQHLPSLLKLLKLDEQLKVLNWFFYIQTYWKATFVYVGVFYELFVILKHVLDFPVLNCFTLTRLNEHGGFTHFLPCPLVSTCNVFLCSTGNGDNSLGLNCISWSQSTLSL